MGDGPRAPLFDLHGDPLAPSGDRGRSALAHASPGVGGTDGGGDVPLCRARMDPKAELLRGIRRRWYVLLPLVVVLAAAGVLFVMERSKPAYRAESLVEVKPLLPHMVFTGEEWRATSIVGYYDDYVRTLVQRVQERPLLEAVIADLAGQGVVWMPPGVPESAWPDVLRARLELSRMRDTYLMAVGFADIDPDVVAPVVNTVVKHFLLAMEDESQSADHWKITALEEERARLQGQMREAHERLELLADDLGSAMLDARQNLFYERINVLETGRTKVLVERAQTEGALVAATARAAALLAQDEDDSVLRQVDADPTVRESRTALQQLERSVEEATRGMSAAHPERVAQLALVAEARERLAALESLTAERERSMRRAERRAEAEELLGTARDAAKGAERSEAILGELMATAREDLQRYGRAMYAGAQLRTEVEGLLRRLAEVDEEIERMRIESRAPSRVSLRTDAVRPGKPVKDKRKMMAGAATIFALVTTLAIGFLLERLRGTLASPGQLAGTRLGAIAAGDALEAATELSFRIGGVPESARLCVVIPADEAAVDASLRMADALAELHGGRRLTVGSGECLPRVGDTDGTRPGASPSEVTIRELARAFVAGDAARRLVAGHAGWTVVSTPPAAASAALARLAGIADAAVVVAARDRSRVAAVCAATAAVRETGGDFDAVLLLDLEPARRRTRRAA